MYNAWAPDPRRKVCAANYNYYRKAEQHPDRIMTEHDLVYMLEGTWGIGQDGESWEIGPGDVIMLQAGHHHYGVTPCAPGTRTMFIHCTSSKEDRVFADGDEPGPALLRTGMVVSCGGRGRIRQLFEDIIDTFWSQAGHRHVRQSALLSLLLWELAEGSLIKTRVRDDMVETIVREIKRNPQRFYGIRELAGRFYVSEKTLTSRFRRVTGQSLHQYQMELKLDMVRMQMRTDPGKSLKELAAAFGFYDEFHMSRLFRRRFGMSPGLCRRMPEDGQRRP